VAVPEAEEGVAKGAVHSSIQNRLLHPLTALTIIGFKPEENDAVVAPFKVGIRVVISAVFTSHSKSTCLGLEMVCYDLICVNSQS